MIQFAEQMRYIPGLVRGLQQPALAGHIHVQLEPGTSVSHAFTGLDQFLPNFEAESQTGDELTWLLGTIIDAAGVLYRGNNTVCSRKYTLAAIKSSDNPVQTFEFFVPLPVPPATAKKCYEWFFDFVKANLSESDPSDSLTTDFKSRMDSLLQEIRQDKIASVNRYAIAMAALDANIPIFPMQFDVYCLGQGINSRLVSSSLTDTTPVISAQLANNKFHTAEYLRTLGLPAPRHLLVGNKQGAIAAASQLGCPVVVKPADRDRGEGVYTNLRDADKVANAYDLARKHSANILVEQYYEGRTHRLTVFQGKLIKVVKRKPGGVIGDGEKTVAQLVDEVQQTRRHQIISLQHGRPVLSLDDEAQALLAEQRLTADSIPEEGLFVPLRYRDNASTGGSNKMLPLEKVHPDNQQLAIDVAHRMRLDIAGIDLIIPDIKESWQSQQAVICEVNCQPTIGMGETPMLYIDILEQLVPKGGRIPLFLAIWDEAIEAPQAALQGLLKSLSCQAFSSKAGVFVDGTLTTGTFANSNAAARALLLNNDVNSGLCLYDSHDLLLYGLPSDHFDCVYILYRNIDGRKIDKELQGALSLLPPGLRREYFEL